MKKLATLAVLVLVALPLLLGGSAPERGLPQASFDIMYDGYCDGVHLTTFGPAAGGYQTGCTVGNMMGSIGGPAAHMSYNVDADFYPYGVHTAIYANHNWTHYGSDGAGGVYVINSGTWSFAVAPAGAAGASSLGR